MITKRNRAIRQRACRLRAKMVAERNFLARKRSRRVHGILKDCPDIGEIIEAFVQEGNVGADAWRRTGVLTFDGNTRVKQKVTYSRIREHLQSHYKRHFAYGSVVQLCVARNKRRRSAVRYKGVAHVTCRRARKGFQLKYNPDFHWSNALYKGLSWLQYTDGRHIMNVNRDDAAGFRLDTMTTHRLHRTPMVQGKQALTTHTDYVNRYPFLLQTTSYNFSGMKTTAEVCIGMVKASGVYPKNPAQHAADISIIEQQPELQPIFYDQLTGSKKSVECIRVDGSCDEGPVHEEVQFFWTARHIASPTIATLVSARNSGASYLNHVELQNGCLALGHANLFIPSTLCGSCLDPKTGKVDPKKLKHNMELATDVYISRVNGCPCGEGKIQLFRGADSTCLQDLRRKLLVFLKSSRREREALEREHPQIYSYLSEVWTVRCNHMVKHLPQNNLFHLVCCFKSSCPHPLCKRGPVSPTLPRWFCDCPDVSYLPIPVPDPARPWGSPDCPNCDGLCYGHFLSPDAAATSLSMPRMQNPPSVTIREAFKKLTGPPTEQEVENLAKDTLLSPKEVRMWLDHLQTIRDNRRRGARKAAETRKKKSSSSYDVYYCGVCHEQYVEYTDQEQSWIECDHCEKWFHFICVGIVQDAVPKKFACMDCKEQ